MAKRTDMVRKKQTTNWWLIFWVLLDAKGGKWRDGVFGCCFWIDPFMEQPEVAGVLGCVWILCWSNINPQWDVFRLQADDEVSLVSLSYKVLCFKHTIGSYWVPSQVPIDWSRPQSLALWTHSGAFQTAAVGAWRVDHKPFLGHQKKAAGSFCKLLVRQNPWDISSCFLFSRRLENNASAQKSTPNMFPITLQGG